MKILIEEVAKYIMPILLGLPFLALVADAAGWTDRVMLKVSVAVMVCSWIVVFLIGGLGNRPNMAAAFGWAFLGWPLALLVAKGWNPNLYWGSLWASVPVMSWYHSTMAIQFHYPADGGGGGLGAGLAFLVGWFYMVIPFAILSGIFVVGRGGLRILKRCPILIRKHR